MLLRVSSESRGEAVDLQAVTEAGAESGVDHGRELTAFAEAAVRGMSDDLQGLKQAFLGGLPDDGNMFQPEIVRDDPEGLDIKFHGCPLRDAWQELGLPEEEVATLCRIAARIDTGTFQGAGFDFSADTYQPDGEGCCYLHIRPGS